MPIAAFLVRLAGGAPAPPGIASALVTSLLTATVSAAIVTVTGVPLAYLLARTRGPAGGLLTALIALPLALPPLMSGLLLLYIVGPYTFLGELFGGHLTDSRAGIVLAQTFVAAPFLILAARAAFAALDPALEDVAASLGHGPLARFRLVAVPAALPGIAAGVMLAWLRSFGEFGATVILAYHPYSLPVLTFAQFDASGLPDTMLPIAVALAAALVVLIAMQLPAPRRRRAHVPSTAPIAAAGQRPRRSTSRSPSGTAAFTLEVAHRAQSPRLALLGPSGAGKTLTLRLIAGLEAGIGDGHVRGGRARPRPARTGAPGSRLRAPAARAPAAPHALAAGHIRRAREPGARRVVDRAPRARGARGSLSERALGRSAATRRARSRARGATRAAVAR